MMTSFKEIQQAEHYIFGQLNIEDRLLFEAQLLVNPGLRANVFFQKKVYHLVKLFNRRKMKRELETIHSQIFNDPIKTEFQQSVLKFFNP